jgi:hypothetical protein
VNNYLVIGGIAASMVLAPALVWSGEDPQGGSDLQMIAEPDPVPGGDITIELVGVNGSGCPIGTAEVSVSEDKKAFTVTYSDYLAQVGVGAGATDFRKNCQLSVLVHVPSGFTYGIAQADYRGFAYLEPGATGLLRANYYFQGMSQTVSSSHQFNGGLEGLEEDWIVTDQVPVAAMVYLPCGSQRNLNINTSLRVLAGTSDPTTTTSLVAMDSTDGSFSTLYHFSWMQCPVAP